MKWNVLKALTGGLTVLLIVWLSSCGKSGSPEPGPPDPPAGAGFTVADFEVYDISAVPDADPHEVNVSYKVRNKTTKNYTEDSNIGFKVVWKVKASDGAIYQAGEGIPFLNAGASGSEALTVGVPVGFTPDISTLTHEIVKD